MEGLANMREPITGSVLAAVARISSICKSWSPTLAKRAQRGDDSVVHDNKLALDFSL